MSLGDFLPVSDQTVLEVVTSQMQYLIFYSLFNFRIVILKLKFLNTVNINIFFSMLVIMRKKQTVLLSL